MNAKYIAVLAGVVVIILAVGAVFLAMPTAPQTSPSSTSNVVPVSSSSSSGNYDFMVFTQKGIAEVASPTGALLGYTRMFNISDSNPAQTYYWNEYPVAGITAHYMFVPLNNGTVIVTDTSSMKIDARMSIGTAIGFIGVAISPNQKLAAMADGTSGIVELVNLTSLQTIWKTTFDTPAGATAFPCDIRWSPDGNTLAVPMRNNNTVDVLSATTGKVTQSTVLPTGTLPYMLTINGPGNMLGVELAGNKTDVFYSYPSLKPLAAVSFPNSTMSPTRGVFTPDGKYYVEASSSSNLLAVISLSNYKVVNMIDLPPSSAPGLADMQITPDGNYAYVIQHGNPTTGGLVYLLSLSNIASATGASMSIPLTTAPAFAIPIPVQTGTYLADNVLSPPVTGLHC